MTPKKLDKVPDDFFKIGHYYKLLNINNEFYYDKDITPLKEKSKWCYKKGLYPCDAYFADINRTCFRDFILEGLLVEVIEKEYIQEELEI